MGSVFPCVSAHDAPIPTALPFANAVSITFDSVAARRMRLDPTPSLHSIVNGLNCPYNSPTVIDFGFTTSILICVNRRNRHARGKVYERILFSKREALESETLEIYFRTVGGY